MFLGLGLANIVGVPMIQRVVKQAQKAKYITEVIVATDDSRIFDLVNKNGGYRRGSGKEKKRGN